VTNRVFVYGTLRKGFGNHRLLEDAKFIGDGEISGHLYLCYGLPMVLRHKDTPREEGSSGTPRVVGEVYEVDQFQLGDLDTLEGHPTCYKREVTNVTMEDGTSIPAHCYFMPQHRLHKNATLIESGDYKS